MNRRTKNIDSIGFESYFFDITRKQRRELRKEFVQDLKAFLDEWELFVGKDGKIHAGGCFTTPDGKWGYDEVCLGPRVKGKEAEK